MTDHVRPLDRQRVQRLDHVGDVRFQVPGRFPVGEPVSAEIRRLRAEVKELRRANEILRAASALFAAELDRPLQRS